MTRLNEIDQKIKDLQLKKQKIRLQAAENLYKNLEKLLEVQFSEQLVLGIVQDALKEKNFSQRKEEWLKAARSFQKPEYSKKAQAL